jgi:hypothetical protein
MGAYPDPVSPIQTPINRFATCTTTAVAKPSTRFQTIDAALWAILSKLDGVHEVETGRTSQDRFRIPEQGVPAHQYEKQDPPNPPYPEVALGAEPCDE